MVKIFFLTSLCDHRRLGGAEALERCQNRRLVFVGDSLNRNMWESLACILYTALPDRSRTRIEDVSSEYRIFRAMVRHPPSSTWFLTTSLPVSQQNGSRNYGSLCG